MPKEIDFFCWTRHHFEHLHPIWEKMNNNLLGSFYISTHMHSLSEYKLPKDLSKFKIYDSFEDTVENINKSFNFLIIPSIHEKKTITINRPIGLVGHGAGQTYIGEKKMPFRQNVIMDIVANNYTKRVFQERYPKSHIVAVGTPKLDRWHIKEKKKRDTIPTIALSFHYDRMLVAETRSAWPHFKEALPLLAKDKRWKLLGHGHPHMIEELIPYYEEFNVEVVRSFEDVLERADLYICDHMSTLYEFASTDRPVVVLNAPWYRRDIEHGLRYWEHANVGVNCDHPSELNNAIVQALIDTDEQKRLRTKAVNAVYAINDGTSARTTANEIIRFFQSQQYVNAVNKLKTIETNKYYEGLTEIFKRNIKESSKVLIYGAGDHTERLIPFIEKTSFDIMGIIDKDISKQGKSLLKYPILNENEISKINPDFIIVSTQAYEEEVYKHLASEYPDIDCYPLYFKNRKYEKDIFNELYFDN